MKNSNDTLSSLITVIGESTASKQQSIIEKKLKRIDSLKKQIEKINTTIATAKELFGIHIASVEKKLFEAKEQLITKLFERLQQKSFTIWQKELLESRIMQELNFLTSVSYESEKLKELNEQFITFQSENMDDFDREIMNEMAKDFLTDMGVEIDEDTFDFEEFKNSDFREQFEQEYKNRQEEDYSNFYQQEEEEKKEALKSKVQTTDKGFQKLYKTLVKKAHPDLVIDPLEKEKREEWMKKLSTVWQERNYYELLLLQQEIDTEITISINDSQLKPLLAQLEQEIIKLDNDRYDLKHVNPETAFYFQNFKAKSKKGILKKIEKMKEDMNDEITTIEHDYTALKTQKSTKVLLGEWREDATMNMGIDNFLDLIVDEVF